MEILSEMYFFSGNGFGQIFTYQSRSEAWPSCEMASVNVDGPGGHHWDEGQTVKVSYKVWFGVHFVDIFRCGERIRWDRDRWQRQIKIVEPGGGIT